MMCWILHASVVGASVVVVVVVDAGLGFTGIKTGYVMYLVSYTAGGSVVVVVVVVVVVGSGLVWGYG